MSPRAALAVAGAVAFAFGAGLFVLPAVLLASSGVAATDQTVALSRGAGATLVGVGVIDWMGRFATGTALRGLLVGNLVLQALSLVANTSAVVTSQLPAQAAGASVVHVVLGALFVLAMRRAVP